MGSEMCIRDRSRSRSRSKKGVLLLMLLFLVYRPCCLVSFSSKAFINHLNICYSSETLTDMRPDIFKVLSYDLCTVPTFQYSILPVRAWDVSMVYAREVNED